MNLKNFSLPNQVNSFILTGIRNPPVIKIAKPLNTKLVAIVDKKECTLNDVIIIPFKYPKIIPIIGAINKPT